MKGKSWHFELKYTKFKTKHHFLHRLTKILEVTNFRYMANFRFITLPVIDFSFASD